MNIFSENQLLRCRRTVILNPTQRQDQLNSSLQTVTKSRTQEVFFSIFGITCRKTWSNIHATETKLDILSVTKSVLKQERNEPLDNTCTYKRI